MKNELVSGRLLLIYQMPKAGSQTIEATLQPLGIPAQIFRLHFLSRARARMVRKGLRKQSAAAWQQDVLQQLDVRRRLARALALRRWMRRFGARIPKVEVITGVREPIGLALSSMFENYYYSFGDRRAAMLERCREDILHPKSLAHLQNWFDAELKPFTRIDVFRHPFSREKGYAVYENRFARVLVYRFEALSSLPAMLCEFLGVEIPAVVSRNIGSTKEYGQAYKFAQEQLRFPPDFVTAACRSKMMRHFYSEDERQRFQEHWTEQAATVQSCDATAVAA